MLSKKKIVVTMMLGVFMLSVLGSASNVYAKDVRKQTVGVSRGNYGTVFKDSPVIKENKSGSSAKIYCYKYIYSYDTVSFTVYNKNDNRVSSSAATFSGTSSGIYKYAPYMSGYGKSGNPFYVRCTLNSRSLSQYIELSCGFVS